MNRSDDRSSAILLAADLDRTLLPNGPAEESPRARPLLRELVRRGSLCVAYVSGRHRRPLYLPRGEFFGMNGNYAAGVLEGMAHFFPEILTALEEIAGALASESERGAGR